MTCSRQLSVTEVADVCSRFEPHYWQGRQNIVGAGSSLGILLRAPLCIFERLALYGSGFGDFSFDACLREAFVYFGIDWYRPQEAPARLVWRALLDNLTADRIVYGFRPWLHRDASPKSDLTQAFELLLRSGERTAAYDLFLDL